MGINLRIALAQINPIVGDLSANKEKILNITKQATEKNCDIVLFPEMVICGYPAEDLLLNTHFIKDIKYNIDQIASKTKDIVSIIGAVNHKRNQQLFNTAVVCSKGKIQVEYQKIILPNYGVFDEKRYFSPGNNLLILKLNGAQILISICEDIWIQDNPIAAAAINKKTDIILNLSSSPFHIGKNLEREKLLTKLAQKTENIVAYVNLIGGQDELVFDGGSMVLNNKGQIISKAPQFEESLIISDIDISTNITNKAPNPSAPKDLSYIFKSINIKPKHIQTKNSSIPQKQKAEKDIKLSLSKEEELFRALVLGLKDYVKKNGFKKVLLGLSGGIDSALVAVIAAQALGKENVLSLSMPSKYSSKETQHDAKLLAEKLGIQNSSVAINSIFDSFLDALSPYFKNLPENIAEENLQARIRGTLLMAFSNKFSWLVISTGNKSEIATGYCTLYGDMVGGFNVLKDVPKTLVYKLANWINQKEEIIPQDIIDRPPTAELKPDQKDQDSLPPYSILDQILELYVEQNFNAEEIVKKGFPMELVKKIIKLVDKNEYKRRQSAPGIKISPRAFGKDRRVPLTNKY